MLLDILSRYVVGWMVARHDSATLGERLLEQSCAKEGIQPGQLTIHADRGPAMRSKPVVWLLADLGITRTHSRPRVSNDNPFSEAQFNTLKYRPVFAARFGGSRTRGCPASGSSPGTIPSIITPASGC